MIKRIDDLEFRYSELNELYEIVRWFPRENSDQSESCITICFYRKNREGYYIQFVGDRPFEASDSAAVWKLMKFGQMFLNASFDLGAD